MKNSYINPILYDNNAHSHAMINYTSLTLMERFSKPLISLIDNFETKFVFATVATFFAQIMEKVGVQMGIFDKIFESVGLALNTNLQFIVSLVLLITIDFFTGIYCSYKKKLPITSMGFRATSVKIIEYFAVIVPFIVLSNMHETLAWIQSWAYIFIAVTEVKSIGENLLLTDERKLMWDKFLALLKEKKVNG